MKLPALRKISPAELYPQANAHPRVTAAEVIHAVVAWAAKAKAFMPAEPITDDGASKQVSGLNYQDRRRPRVVTYQRPRRG
jgi:hypothetical protein